LSKPLTPRQRQCLVLIREAIDKTQEGPLLRELASAMSMRSASGPVDHMWALENMGYIRSIGGKRGTRLTELGRQATEPTKEEKQNGQRTE